jgi:hypothetical protein
LSVFFCGPSGFGGLSTGAGGVAGPGAGFGGLSTGAGGVAGPEAGFGGLSTGAGGVALVLPGRLGLIEDFIFWLERGLLGFT